MNITLSDIVEYLIIGIITGMFASFAPVMIAHAIDSIMSIIKRA